MSSLEDLLDLIISFDFKLLLEVLDFPINLYKIYNYYRDPNNPEKKYEMVDRHLRRFFISICPMYLTQIDKLLILSTFPPITR